MKIGELFVQLGFKADDTKLKDFVRSMGDLNMSSILATFGLGEAYNIIKKIMDTASESALGINAFSKETGLSSVKMQQFANFAKEMGGSAEDATSSIKALQMNMAKIAIGEGNIRPFMLTGISPYQSIWKILDQIHEKMLDPRIPAAYKRMIAQEFGLSESMLVVLKSSNAQWESIKNQLYTTEEQTKAMMRYHAAWSRVGTTWRQVFMDVATTYAPDLERLAQIIGGILLKLHEWGPVLRTIAELILTVVSFFVPWLRIPTIIYLITTHIGFLIDRIKELWGTLNENKMFKAFRAFMTFGPLGGLFNARDQVIPALSGVTSGNRTINQENNFNITGDNADDIAHKVEQLMRKSYSSVEYQAPAESR